MPKQKLGTGNKRAVLQRPGTSYTSPNAIKLQQRRATALDYRLQGHPFWKIGKALNCQAEDGDIHAQEAVLRIMHARARYLGLYPDAKGGGVHVNIGSSTAEDEGIQVVFVRPDRVRKLAEEEDRKAKVAKVIEGFPVADLKPL